MEARLENCDREGFLPVVELLAQHNRLFLKPLHVVVD